MGKLASKRDRAITREIHRIFWAANFKDWVGLLISYLARIPANIAYNIVIPIYVAYGIQAVIHKDMAAVRFNAVAVVAASLVYVLLWFIGGIYISRNAIVGTEYLQRLIFNSYLHKDFAFYSDNYYGALGSHISSLREAFNGYGEIVTLAIPKQLVIVGGGLIVIATQSLALAGISALAMVLVVSFTILSSRWRLQYRRRVGEASSDVSGVVGDAISHGATVVSYAAQDYEMSRLEEPMLRLSRAQYVSWISSLPADSIRTVSAAVATAVLLYMSAQMYIRGAIPLTIVVLVQLYVVRLISSTLEITELVKRYETYMGSAYAPVKTMLIEPAVKDPPKAKRLSSRRPLDIVCDNISFRYPGQRQQAVRDFTLAAVAGERIGLVGYSGSGKTTLTKLLMRFMDVQSGEIRLQGINITMLRQSDLRSHMAYVPQEPLLFHRSIRDNILYGNPDASSKALTRVVRDAYINEFVDDLPEGLDTLVGEHGIKLSGGQRQRVAIARAMLKNAPILLLDEATSALDSKSEKYIQKALWNLMEGRTAIVIAHRLSTIQKLDRILVVDKGRIVQSGSHQELLDQAGIYAELWEHQSGGYIGKPITSSLCD